MEKTSSLKRLEVRLDSPTIVVDNPEDVQTSRFVTGRIVLMNQEPLPIRTVKVWLRAERKVSWFIKSFSYQFVKNIDNILAKEATLYPPSPHVKPANRLEPGNHVWQFYFELETPIAQSIHGLCHASLRYTVEAEVQSRGFLSPTLRASQNLRVLHHSTILGRERSLEHQKQSWVGSKGVEYTVYAPPDYHRWGEPIDFDLRIPRSTSMRRVLVKFQLREEIKLQALFNQRLASDVKETIIAKGEKDLTNESSAIQLCFPLPQSLTVCRQSVEEERIHISHRITIELEAEDEDGKIEQVNFSFPFYLAFPLGVAFDEQGDASFDGVRKITTGEEADLSDAPPPFGIHDQDELYAQDSVPFYLFSTGNGHRAMQRLSPIFGDARTTSPADTTPSYDLAIRGPELPVTSGSSLPTYENINADRIGTDVGDRGQIVFPSPAVCRGA